ncbi:a-pheromone processing metallopeptidase Ste23 [Aulographum hederae CBS 113979]|uniref:A-pheromone processing metallopeptidase Ste23 n=1 Tax=Aulographum hederae CBS 113979 TaxID=1176131 RepID=A0A6G1GLS1_9PEZI|nr:a-pheromone processing metallopeptidase Ste23 [Aulographum hederae CBS 113979]
MADPVNTRAAMAERLTDNMERPVQDDRSYRVVRLPNRLEVLLIHDPETDKASAALDVNVGSFNDRDDMPGIAHAVEHLLFMGTEKYPVENAYNQYLTAHSGTSNAFTASTSTNYYFEVAASNTPANTPASSASTLPIEKTDAPLYGALDRFAQFFVAPLFLEDTLDRELRAVDSENKKNLQNDTWRFHQLNKTLSNPNHPFCHFSTGSYKTLHDEPLARGVKIRDEFIDFYRRNYSANRMKLVVLGRERLDELESWVVELFSDVPNRDLPQDRWDGLTPFREEELMTQVFAKPVLDSRMLDLYFPYQDEEEMFESKPGRYISHLIGHEGPGSILAYIKKKGWANSLGSGPLTLCPGSAMLSVSIRLTEEGLKNYQEVVKVFFQYVSMLHESPPQEWIAKEMQVMSEVNFRYRQKLGAAKTCSGLSGMMHKPYPRDQLLSAPNIIKKFDPVAIKEGLSYLRPENCRVTLVSQEYPGGWDMKEKWYGTEYKYDKMPQDFVSMLQDAFKNRHRPAELHLPHKNEFIPTRLEVEKKEVAEPMKTPWLIRHDESVRAWWKKDDRFWVPKGTLQVTLRSLIASVTPRMAVMAHLYRELVQDSLDEYSYDAEIAGLHYGLLSHSLGIDITVSGYNDKMNVLLEKVLLALRDLEIRDERFDIIKERLLRGYRNWELQQPFHQIGTYSRLLRTERGWTNEQFFAELPHITAEDVRAFVGPLLSQMHIELLAHGNFHKEDALRFIDLIESTLKPRRLPPALWPIRRTLVFPPGCNYLYERTLKDPANVNHCIEYLLYIGLNTDRGLRAKLLLFAQMCEEPAFNQLRTKEQLGYVVFSGATINNSSIGYRVLIQSEKDCAYLEKRIDAFLDMMGERLESMTDGQFEKHKISLVNKRLERLKNLTQESDRFWSHCMTQYYDFEQGKQISSGHVIIEAPYTHMRPAEYDAEHITQLTKPDILAFYAHHVSPDSAHRAHLSVHLIARASPASVAATKSPEMQRDETMALITQFLAAQAIPADNVKLTQRFEKVDVVGGDALAMVEALMQYLVEDEKVDGEKAREIVQKGQDMMARVLPAAVGIDVAHAKENGGLGEVVKNEGSEVKEGMNEVIMITDVQEWKAGLGCSPGARPVVDLATFEEGAAKL